MYLIHISTSYVLRTTQHESHYNMLNQQFAQNLHINISFFNQNVELSMINIKSEKLHYFFTMSLNNNFKKIYFYQYIIYFMNNTTSKSYHYFHHNMLDQIQNPSSSINTCIMFSVLHHAKENLYKQLLVSLQIHVHVYRNGYINHYQYLIQNSLLVKCLKCGYQYITLLNMASHILYMHISAHNYHNIYAILDQTIPQHTENVS